MQDLIEIRPLQQADAPALLAFELTNRSWFERHVEPRAASTYSVAGIEEHIAQALAARDGGSMLPFVLADTAGTIFGRANLKDIDRANGSAEIGYRIAEHAAGQGLGTLAVQHLLASARSLGLRQLAAIISVENSASARAVERAGFVRGASLPGHAALLHAVLDCWRYQLALTPAEC